MYLILVLTFGFALLTTEIAIGRKTGQGPLTAYGLINPKGKFIGVLACIVPAIILPYYCTIGGWVLKYFTLFITGSGKMRLRMDISQALSQASGHQSYLEWFICL